MVKLLLAARQDGLALQEQACQQVFQLGGQLGRPSAQPTAAAAPPRRGAGSPCPDRATDPAAGGQLPALRSPVTGRSACQPMRSTNACKG